MSRTVAQAREDLRKEIREVCQKIEAGDPSRFLASRVHWAIDELIAAVRVETAAEYEPKLDALKHAVKDAVQEVERLAADARRMGRVE